MMRKDFLSSPDWAAGARLILVMMAMAGSAFLLCRYLLWICVAASVAAMGCCWCASLWLLARHGLVISPVAPMLAVVVGTVFLGLVRFRGEERAAIRMAGELALAQDCAIIGLVSVVETRDAETGQHIIRTRHYVRLLAERLACHPRFRRELTPENIEAIVKSAALHDIGKVGISDAILRKPVGLDQAETLVMRQHTLMGKHILERACQFSGADAASSFLAFGVDIACSHHEQWNGSGYPSGLKGEAIPISARLMSLADVYDALRSKRHYKEPMPHAEALACIVADSGSRFDPDVVRAFLETQDSFQMFSGQHADSSGEGC
jgi:adenylate cyclase